MPYTSEFDKSMIELLKAWNPNKHYIIVASTKILSGEYVVFEPSFVFTKYDIQESIWQIKETEETVIYVYQLFLPCDLNPYIYFFFNNSEYSALDIMGDAKTFTKIPLHFSDDSNDVVSSDPVDILSRQILQNGSVTYDLSDKGELVLSQAVESVFFNSQYEDWAKQQYIPYYYLNNEKQNHQQLSIVYSNEQTELDLIKRCASYTSSNVNAPSTIYDFIHLLQGHFLKLIESKDRYSEISEYVKLLYKKRFNSLSCKETFDLIGQLVSTIQQRNLDNKFIDIHYVLMDRNGLKPYISNEEEDDESLYDITFYSRHFTITVYGKELLNSPYTNTCFEYGFLLV